MRSSRSFASEVLFGLTVVGLIALSLVWVATKRFEARTLPNIAPTVTRPALTPRLAFVVLDGVREDRFRTLMPETVALAEARGTVCSVEGPALSFTLSGVYGLGTGDVATLAQIPSNFESRPAGVDSLPAALSRQGGRTCLFGERLWADLFGSFAVAGDTTRDKGPFEQHGANTIDAFANELRSGVCELAVFHDAEFDALGHRHGLHADEYVRYASSVDRQLEQIVDDVGPSTTWFVTSDHGMLDSGGHGGPQREARRGACSQRLDQADVPTTAAALLGAAIPWHSRGGIADILDVAPAARAALDGELLEQKRQLSSQLSAAYAPAASTVPKTLGEYIRAIDEIQNPSSSRCVLAALFPLAMAIVVLVRQARVARWTLIRPPVIVPLAASLIFGWGFANCIYPTISYGASTLVQWAAVGGSFVVSTLLVRRARIAPTWVLGIVLAAVVSVETHWIAHLQPLVMGGLVWLACSKKRAGMRWLVAVFVVAVAFAVIELAWTNVFSTRGASGPIATFAVVVLTGWFGAMALSKAWPVGIDHRSGKTLTAAYVFAATYCLALAAPAAVRLWVPVAVTVLCLLESRWIRELTAADATVAGFLAFFALQMTPLTWGALIVTSVVSFAWLDSPDLDRALGPRAAAWARGAGLLATAYAFTVIEGNHFLFTDINVLTGFVGGSVKLHLPLTAALVSIYYAAPLVATVGLWLRLSRQTGPAAAADDRECLPAAPRCSDGIHARPCLNGFAICVEKGGYGQAAQHAGDLRKLVGFP